MTTTDTTTECRRLLPLFAHGRSVLIRTVPSSVATELRERGLIVEQTAGLYTSTRRAEGYVADPSTFEAGGR